MQHTPPKLLLRSAPVLFMSCALTLFASCAHNPNADREADRKKIENELSGEMSLKADRDQLSELRKGIPEERRKTNDELALYLQTMNQGTEQPQMVFDKFSTLLQKKRQSFRDKVFKLRESYHHSEAIRREEYLNEQKAKRDSYLHTKRSTEESRQFYSDQDRERQEFFAEERARRLSFESEVTAQSKDFDSYMHEKSNEFNEQYRLYAKRFTEKPKESKAVTGGDSNSTSPSTRGGSSGDFKQMDQLPAKTLGTEN